VWDLLEPQYANPVALASLLKIMVMLDDAPPTFVAKLSTANAEIVAKSRLSAAHAEIVTGLSAAHAEIVTNLQLSAAQAEIVTNLQLSAANAEMVANVSAAQADIVANLSAAQAEIVTKLSAAYADIVAKLQLVCIECRERGLFNLSELTTRGRHFRAQLPLYLEQQRASVAEHCPLPSVLQSTISEYAATTPEDMWAYGLRI
jgi:hypothetical protein